MNELKPEDVIRALECCICGTSEACLSCAWRMTPYPACRTVVMRHALTLIREKDAEIERLKAENAVYANNVEKVAENYHRQGKADAITEFAERLKSALLAGGIYPVIVKNAIDQIAKEMKGEGATHGE
ncbi:MAG: hypothetical protein IKA46_02790 [Clostridia bacterium]|nr:hypothetical protein [Clostridia bacterium]